MRWGVARRALPSTGLQTQAGEPALAYQISTPVAHPTLQIF